VSIVTLDQEKTAAADARRTGGPRPGLLVLFSNGRPALHAIPLNNPHTVGRGGTSGVTLDDPYMSREHAVFELIGDSWLVRDLGSRNGTFVDGEPLRGPLGRAARVVRAGETLFVVVPDIRPYEHGTVETRELVFGPTMQAVWRKVELAASGERLHVTGESGTGKELAARHFHAQSARRGGPFVAVNCAAIPPALAERLLFGARKGAFTGASANVHGYVQEAHQGTLFLDEVADLDLSVQAKLLRVLESKEVIPLGASKPEHVDLAICSATHADLSESVARGRFREDLYFRLGRPMVQLKPLRERVEEIPWLIHRELTAIEGLTDSATGGSVLRPGPMPPQASLIEACLLRSWPGNVRELLTEVRLAASAAAFAGGSTVKDSHLSAAAGQRVSRERRHEPRARAAHPFPGVPAIEEALEKRHGNVSGAARLLRVPRTQLRRWISRFHIDAIKFRGLDTTTTQF
jgi:DNA-binding NtrC family response regulator